MRRSQACVFAIRVSRCRAGTRVVRGLSVTGDGIGVIVHAGNVAVRLLARRVGQTGHLIRGDRGCRWEDVDHACSPSQGVRLLDVRTHDQPLGPRRHDPWRSPGAAPTPGSAARSGDSGWSPSLTGGVVMMVSYSGGSIGRDRLPAAAMVGPFDPSDDGDPQLFSGGPGAAAEDVLLEPGEEALQAALSPAPPPGLLARDGPGFAHHHSVNIQRRLLRRAGCSAPT